MRTRKAETDAPGRAGEAAPAAAVASPATPAVLVVDDDEASRTALVGLLSGPGRAVYAADSGKQALRLLLQHDFAVILLDVQMPVMSGFEVARYLRERKRSHDTPIIFLTGAHVDVQSEFRGYSAGAVDYIQKPPDPAALRSKVAAFVALDRAQALLRREIAERRAAEAQLRISEESLRALTSRLEHAREEERARISREIHDQLGQQLTAFKMGMRWIAGRLHPDQRALATRAAALLDLVDATIDSVRRIATELRPAISEQLGLLAAIEWQAQDFRRRTGIRCRLAAPAELPAIDHDRAAAMYRVFQELLTNVARHAEATRVEVRLALAADLVVLAVTDNGKGMAPGDAAGSRGLGFLGMRERLRPFGGTIEVDYERKSGTRVTARLPLVAAAPSP